MSFPIRDGAPFTVDDMQSVSSTRLLRPGSIAEPSSRIPILYERARRDHKKGVSVTHLLFIKGVLAAYVTLMADRIQLGPDEKPRGVSWQLVPGLKIAQLAVDLRFSGYGLGRFLIGYAVETANAFRAVVGLRYITLDAEPNPVPWYESQGFVRNREEQRHRESIARERGRNVEELAISMRFDLREPDV